MSTSEFFIYLLIKLCYMTSTAAGKSEKWLFTFLVSNIKVDKGESGRTWVWVSKISVFIKPTEVFENSHFITSSPTPENSSFLPTYWVTQKYIQFLNFSFT